MTQIDRGGGHAVLLLHGLLGSPLEMQYLAKRFRQAGFITRAPHIPGYGFGAHPDARTVGTWEQWHAQVLDEFDALARSHESVSVCGLCIGAVLALSLAAERRSEVAALSLLGTTLAFDGWSIPWYRFLAPLAYYTPLRHFYFYRERHPYGLKNEALRNWVAREMSETTTSIAGAARLPMTGIYQTHRLIRHVRRMLPLVRVPALVVHARDDDVASVRSAEFVLENIGSQEISFSLLHDSYHIISMDNEKHRVAEETIRFFRNHPASGVLSQASGRTLRLVSDTGLTAPVQIPTASHGGI